MGWLYLTLLSVFLASIANILQRVLMRGDRSNPYAYAVVFHFSVSIIYAIFALFHGFKLPPLSFQLVYFVLAAFLWGIGTVFLFKALQLLESSEVTILGSSKALVTIGISMVVLKESFNIQKLLGTLIIVGAVLLVSNIKKGMKINKGLLYIFVMVLFYGSAVVVDAVVLKHYEPISYLAVANVMIGSILVVLNPKIVFKLHGLIHKAFLKKMIPVIVFSSSQAVPFYIALGLGGHVSQMGSINQAQVILTVLLAIIFLGEKDHLMRKLFGGVLTTIGILLVS